MKAYILALIVFACISFVAFVVYIIDKIKAVNGRWRIPEKVLLCLSFFGGGIGSYLAMFLARHKTRKVYFHVVNILGIALQVGIVVALAVCIK